MVWEQKVLFTFIIVELFIIIFKIERGIEDRAESDFFPFQRHFNIHDGYVVNYSIKRPVQESNPQHSKQGPVATGPDLYIEKNHLRSLSNLREESRDLDHIIFGELELFKSTFSLEENRHV